MDYERSELITITASRLLQDGKIVFAGVGTPLLASVLAWRTHAPHLSVVVEGGAIGTEVKPGELPISTNEMRAARRAMMLPGITDLFLYAQRGFFDYGFLGGAQIDPYGNINTSVIGPRPRLPGPTDSAAASSPLHAPSPAAQGTRTAAPAQRTVRLPGSGGANDIISLCRQVFLVMAHEPRRFVERLDFLTSPGHLDGPQGRQRAGLLFGTVTHVVTDLALLTFHEQSRRMQVAALQPGVELEQVLENTGFELLVPAHVARLEPPSAEELAILRSLAPPPD